MARASWHPRHWRARRAAVARRRLRRPLPTITVDDGAGFHDDERLERGDRVTCCLATLRHSWGPGSHESLNGLVRRYLPLRRRLKRTPQADGDRTAAAPGGRSRERHGFRTPPRRRPPSRSALHFTVESGQRREHVTGRHSLARRFARITPVNSMTPIAEPGPMRKSTTVPAWSRALTE